MLVLHYTGMPSGAEALARLCDRGAKVSAHYLIEEDGTVFRLVAEEERAWHAGISCWRGNRNINDRSIGVELVNPGHDWGYREFPEAQMANLETLATGILARHPIPPRNVVGHSDVAPSRKCDPGELFDWHRLAMCGIGLWPDSVDPSAARGATPQTEVGTEAGPILAMLRDYGYDTEQTGVIAAFQRHFRPARINDAIDTETAAAIVGLAAAAGV